jgi:hypothetical protein
MMVRTRTESLSWVKAVRAPAAEGNHWQAQLPIIG